MPHLRGSDPAGAIVEMEEAGEGAALMTGPTGAPVEMGILLVVEIVESGSSGRGLELIGLRITIGVG